MRPLRLIAAAVLAVLVLTTGALAAKRVALVIGNGQYTALTKLNNPVGDARAISAALKAQGFQVMLRENLDRATFLDALDNFRFAADGADVALVYYAGHGMEVNGRNIVAPVDADIDCATKRSRRTVPVGQLFTALSPASNQILILDFCRNDPFPTCTSKSIGGGGGGFRGLTRDAGPATHLLVANATGVGQEAADGPAGAHSPFATALLRRIKTDSRQLVLLTFDSVANDVKEATNGAQIPEVFSPGGAPRICLAGSGCGTGGGDDARLAALKGQVADLTARLAAAPTGAQPSKAISVEPSGNEAALRKQVEDLKAQLAAASARPAPVPTPPPPAVSATGVNSTLAEVKARGHLNCGVSTGLPGFSAPDAGGTWRGIDADLCRAIAAAVFGDGDGNRVTFVPLTAKMRFTALQSGEVDVLIRNTSWTTRRETTLGLRFAGTNLYDGLTFMVRKDLGVISARELSGAAICLPGGSTTELEVARYFKANGMDYEPVAFESEAAAVAAFQAGRCDTVAGDATALYLARLSFAEPESQVVLPERLTREQLGPYVRADDNGWFNIVQTTLDVLFWAEELGITSKNIDRMYASDDPTVRRLLGAGGDLGPSLGLSQSWAGAVIRAVGNYGEYFARNLGEGSPIKMTRGQNDLVARGGLIAAPALR